LTLRPVEALTENVGATAIISIEIVRRVGFRTSVGVRVRARSAEVDVVHRVGVVRVGRVHRAGGIEDELETGDLHLALGNRSSVLKVVAGKGICLVVPHFPRRHSRALAHIYVTGEVRMIDDDRLTSG